MDLLFCPSPAVFPNPIDYAMLTDELLLRDLWFSVPEYTEKKKIRKRMIEVRKQTSDKAKQSAKPEAEAPKYRISRTGSFEEKLRRARMEASQPIEVPVSANRTPKLIESGPKKHLSWSVDTDEDNRPDFSFDSGNASGSDSEHHRKSLSDSCDDGTSSDDERILKEFQRKDSDELMFPGSDYKITKVSVLKNERTSPLTIQVETKPPTDVGRTVFELLSSNNPQIGRKAFVPTSSSLVSSLIKKKNQENAQSNNVHETTNEADSQEEEKSEFPSPEEIDSVEVLQEMLMEETEYDQRRKIRSRIRQLKREKGEEDDGTVSPRFSPAHVKYAQIHYIEDSGENELKPRPMPRIEVQRLRGHEEGTKNSNGLPPGNAIQVNVPRLIKKKRITKNMDDDEYINLDEITDEEELNELLEDTDDIDERKKIRTRLLEVKADKRSKREARFKKRDDDREDHLKKKAQEAEAQKKRTMAMYDEAARSAPAGGNKSFNMETYAAQPGSARNTPSRQTGEGKKNLVEDAIKSRALEAENRKKRILAAYDHASKSSLAGGEKMVNFEAFKKADVSTFQPKALQPGSSTFGMSGGVPDMKGPFKANLVSRQISGGSEPQELDSKEKAIRDRVKAAEDHKKKLLAAYDMAAKQGGGPKQVILSDYLNEVQDLLPKTPEHKFKQMDAVANKQGNNQNINTMFGPPLPIVRQSAAQIKQTVLEFCRKNTADYKNVNITNFSSSWANGLAFCALTHHFYPHAFDYNSLDAKNRRYNFDLGFKAAEDHGGVCPLLETDDMIMMKDKPDWKCVFTYVQSLYQKYRNLE